MNDNEIRNAFEKMTDSVDPAQVEDAVWERLSAKEKRRRVRFPRAAVVFACVLAVTALSAGAYAVRKNITIQPHPDGHGPYLMMTHADEDALKFPLLSEEVIEQIEERNIRNEEESSDDFYERRIKFSSWEEAEEWLGCDLLISDMLSEPQQNTIWGADILVEASWWDNELIEALGMENAEEGLWNITLDAAHLVENEEEHMLCYIKMTIPVSENFAEMLGNWGYGRSGYLYGGEPEGEPEVMSYHAENGLDAELVGMYKRYEGSHIYNPVVYHVNAYTIHEGILYDIAIWEKDKDFTIQTMQKLLDSFE